MVQDCGHEAFSQEGETPNLVFSMRSFVLRGCGIGLVLRA